MLDIIVYWLHHANSILTSDPINQWLKTKTPEIRKIMVQELQFTNFVRLIPCSIADYNLSVTDSFKLILY